MNILQLGYFLDVVRCEDYSAAAELNFMTRQAIVKSVGGLEAELGVSLFEKKDGKIEPSAFALAFASQAKCVVDDFNGLYSLADCLKHVSTIPAMLRVAVISSQERVTFVSYEDAECIRHACSESKVKYIYRHKEGCLAAVRSGAVHAAIVAGPFEGGDFRRALVGRLESCAIMGNANPLANLKSLPIDRLACAKIALPYDLGSYYASIKAYFEAKRIAPPEFVDIGHSLEDARAFLQSGGLIIGQSDCLLLKAINDARAIALEGERLFDVSVYAVERAGSQETILPLLCEVMKERLSNRKTE